MLNVEQYAKNINGVKEHMNVFLLKKYKNHYDCIRDYFKKTVNSNIPIIVFNVDINNYDSLSFDSTITCYSQNMIYHVHEIANNLAKVSDEYPINMSTDIPYKLFRIDVDSKRLLLCKGLDNIFPIYKLIFTKNTKKMINPKIHLINIYNKLINPIHCKDWKLLLEDEFKIFKTLQCKNIKINTLHDTIQKISASIFSQLIHNNDKIILTGETAINIILKQKKKLSYTLEIVSELHFKIIFEKVTDILKNFNNLNLQYRHELVQLIDDKKFKRFTLFVILEGKRYNILYCYNNTQYQLIPADIIKTSGGSFLICSPVALIYFLLINIWTISWIIIDKKLSNKHIENQLNHINNTYINFRDYISQNNLPLFSSQYYGSYVDELVEIKVSKQKLGRFIPPYNPHLFKKKMGEYKQVNI